MKIVKTTLFALGLVGTLQGVNMMQVPNQIFKKLFSAVPLLSSKILTLPPANNPTEKYGMFAKNSKIFPGDILHKNALKKIHPEEIIDLINEGNIPVLEELLTYKIFEVNKPILKNSTLTPLAHAIYAAIDPANGSQFTDKNLEIIQLFINHKAPLDQPIPVLYNLPALHFACTRHNGLPLAEKLVKNGANYKLPIKGPLFSGTPQKIAEFQGFIKIADYFASLEKSNKN